MIETQFHFRQFLYDVQMLKSDIKRALHASSEDQIRELVNDIPDFEGNGEWSHDYALTVAFVGQYNAGKSSIISALTNRCDIPIDADVCTDRVAAYDWNGILLIDTPGIHAGYPEHDAITYKKLDESDLLVFVITNELFDNYIGNHFRELAFSRNKAGEILLVVNKMSQDPGMPADKLPDIAKVTKPLSPEDFETVFIDAKDCLEASEEDSEEERLESLEHSNFGAFVQRLNSFVETRGLLGRLTTPVYVMRRSAEQALAYLSTDMPEERIMLELLNRKRNLYQQSKNVLKTKLEGVINQGITDIILMGDAFADSFRSEHTETEIQINSDKLQTDVKKRCSRIQQDTSECIKTELEHLHSSLEVLQKGPLATKLLERFQAFKFEAENQGSRPGIEPQRKAGDLYSRVQNLTKMAAQLSEFAATRAIGPFATATNVGTATAARGSDLHNVVYNVGKFFGYKFQPWQAVNTAKFIGNAGRIFGAVGGAVAVFCQIMADQKEDQQVRELRNGRDEIRTYIRQCAKEVENSFWAAFDAFSRDFYDIEMNYISQEIATIVLDRDARSGESERFKGLVERATALISDIQTKCLTGSSIQMEIEARPRMPA